MPPAATATSRTDDHRIIRRAVKRLWICLAVVVASIVGPALVPDAWKARVAWTGLRVPYADPDPVMPQEAVISIGPGFTTSTGEFVTEQMIRLQVWPQGAEYRSNILDDANIAALRAAFIKDNAHVLGADAGPLFDRAITARRHGGDITVFYGWRLACSLVVITLRLSSFAALIFAFYATRTLIAAKRRSRLGLCAQCGYDLQGLAPLTPCPECGSVRAISQTN